MNFVDLKNIKFWYFLSVFLFSYLKNRIQSLTSKNGESLTVFLNRIYTNITWKTILYLEQYKLFQEKCFCLDIN